MKHDDSSKVGKWEGTTPPPRTEIPKGEAYCTAESYYLKEDLLHELILEGVQCPVRLEYVNGQLFTQTEKFAKALGGYWLPFNTQDVHVVLEVVGHGDKGLTVKAQVFKAFEHLACPDCGDTFRCRRGKIPSHEVDVERGGTWVECSGVGKRGEGER